MLSDLAGVEIYLAAGATDMRNSITGLSYLVEQRFERNPRDCHLYLFCNSRRNRLKILQYDVNGYWLYYKRLDSGHFVWPREGSADVLELSQEELAWLLHGTHLVGKRASEKARELRSY